MEIISVDVVIVGAGIAGLATAIALMKVGVRALVLERSHELRATGGALNLFPNAWVALEALGVAHKLTRIYTPLDKGYITNVATGEIQEVSYARMDRTGKGLRSVHRRALVEALAEELPPGMIRFSSKLVSIETQTLEDSSPIAILHMEDGTIIKAEVLVGCDGVHSVVARWLGLTTPIHSGRTAVLGMAKFPQGHGFNHEVHQFLGHERRAGCVPLNDKEVYWFITYKSYSMELTRDPELIREEVMEHLAKDLPPKFLDLVQHSDPSTLTWAPLMLRYPWDLILGHICKGNITVAGDAMHPMTPDLGQGGCAALEDAVVLGRNIGTVVLRHGKMVSGAIEKYAKERRWRTAGLIVGSYLAGRAQQGGSGRMMKFIREMFFYRFVYRRIVDIIHYDCGKLPSVSSLDELN
ncbi:hypothetical protein HHK36_009320 [Tetracentron sinense]|uniref:FAD-binding domain-containing protein n=1 Tax=Tetracentron sinense TaxID=13715 RepID=A0A834ZCQ5_TETSI|nr:hypothetical protein HHK36_009320 [Tetracentron sinense]